VSVTIRNYRAGDAPAMAAVYERAIRAVGATHYTPEQVEAWIGGAHTLQSRIEERMTDGRRCWVAVDPADRVVAFVDLEGDGHIDILYADPDVAGQGVAARLLDALEAAARAAKIDRLYVEASEPACRFFTRRGYRTVQRRDFELRGVAIHNYAMEIGLGSAD
jgi:putative acetyltransferase